MIIAVASFKGGVGKTTTAIHLAAYCQNNADTVLIDADPNRSATAWSQRGKLPFDVVDEWQPARMKHYGHVIIDTQARPGPEDLAIIADTCELIVLPTTPDILALDALTLTLEYLHAIDARRYRVLLTIIPPKPSKDGEQARDMLNSAGIPIFQGSIRRLAAFHKAATAGQLVYEVRDQRSPLGWQDYQHVGEELLGKASATAPRKPIHSEPPNSELSHSEPSHSELSHSESSHSEPPNSAPFSSPHANGAASDNRLSNDSISDDSTDAEADPVIPVNNDFQ